MLSMSNTSLPTGRFCFRPVSCIRVIDLVRLVASQGYSLLGAGEGLSRRDIDASAAVLSLPADVAGTADDKQEDDNEDADDGTNDCPLVPLDPAAH
jgi:hypothetical protein